MGCLGPAVPTLRALQRLRKLVWQGELWGASLLQAALSLLPSEGDTVILRGWAEAPLSPRLQDGAQESKAGPVPGPQH